MTSGSAKAFLGRGGGGGGGGGRGGLTLHSSLTLHVLGKGQ